MNLLQQPMILDGRPPRRVPIFRQRLRPTTPQPFHISLDSSDEALVLDHPNSTIYIQRRRSLPKSQQKGIFLQSSLSIPQAPKSSRKMNREQRNVGCGRHPIFQENLKIVQMRQQQILEAMLNQNNSSEGSPEVEKGQMKLTGTTVEHSRMGDRILTPKELLVELRMAHGRHSFKGAQRPQSRRFLCH